MAATWALAAPVPGAALLAVNDACVKKMVEAMTRVTSTEGLSSEEKQQREWRLEWEVRSSLEEHFKAYEDSKQKEMDRFSNLMAAKCEQQVACRTRRHVLQQRHSIGIFNGQENIVVQGTDDKKPSEDRLAAERVREAWAALEDERRTLAARIHEVADREEKVNAEYRTVEEMRIDLEVEKDRMIDSQRQMLDVEARHIKESVAARERAVAECEASLRAREETCWRQEAALDAERARLVAERRIAEQERLQQASELQCGREALKLREVQLAEEERALATREAEIAARRRSLEGEAERQQELADQRRREALADRRASEGHLREEHQKLLEQKRDLEQELAERHAAAVDREAQAEARKAQAEATIEELRAGLLQEQQQLEELRRALAARSEELKDYEAKVLAIKADEAAHSGVEQRLAARGEELERREAALAEDAQRLEARRRELQAQQQTFERSTEEAVGRSRAARECEQAAAERMRVVLEQEATANAREQALVQREQEVLRREANDSAAAEESLKAKRNQSHREILAKMEKFDQWKADLTKRENDIVAREKSLADKESKLETVVDDFELRCKEKHRCYDVWERGLSDKESRLEELEAVRILESAATSRATTPAHSMRSGGHGSARLQREPQPEAAWQRAARPREEQAPEGFAALAAAASEYDAEYDRYSARLDLGALADAAEHERSRSQDSREFTSDDFAALSALAPEGPLYNPGGVKKKRLVSRKQLEAEAAGFVDEQPSPKLRCVDGGASAASRATDQAPGTARRILEGITSLFQK